MGTDRQLRKIKHQKDFSLTYPFKYILQEQRLVCLLIGIAVSCVVFNVVPSLSPPRKGLVLASDGFVSSHRRFAYEMMGGFGHLSAGIINFRNFPLFLSVLLLQSQFTQYECRWKDSFGAEKQKIEDFGDWWSWFRGEPFGGPFNSAWRQCYRGR